MHSIDGHLLDGPYKPLYCQPEFYVCVNGKQSKSNHVGVGLRQGSVLSSLFFMIYVNWMDKLSRTNENVSRTRPESKSNLKV